MTHVAKNHLSFATAFFNIIEPNKGTKGPQNHSLDLIKRAPLLNGPRVLFIDE
jgi:hypothetical protein